MKRFGEINNKVRDNVDRTIIISTLIGRAKETERQQRIMVKNNEQNKHETTCGCDMNISEIIGSLPVLGGIGMMIVELSMAPHDPDCTCARCQSNTWKENDKVDAEIVFTDDEIPVLRVKLPGHRDIERVISLRENLAEAIADQIVWEKIVDYHKIEEYDKSLYDQLSNASRIWLKDSAMKALAVVKSEGGKDKRIILKEVTGPNVFLELLADRRSYENEAFNKKLKKIREVATQSDKKDIQAEIDSIIGELPDDLKEATEIPTLSIPLEELESVIRKYQADLGGL